MRGRLEGRQDGCQDVVTATEREAADVMRRVDERVGQLEAKALPL